ncbi:MAG TPA: cytochrome c family protein [Allosphingosinicella sp.]|nr:cytochrome c family protein [Allosphingosinicella sp.]
MDNRFNTIAGWTLGAGIVFLGAWLVTGEMFHSARPDTMGYPIKGVKQVGPEEAVEQPIAHFLQTADAARGQGQFSKCAACHTVTQGGANGLGPNLWGRMGSPIASVAGYSYSSALQGKAGETWSWDAMSAWLQSPRRFAEGTKMTFAGLSDPQDRADLLLYLNGQGGSLQIPPPPAAAAPDPAAGAADAPAPGENAARAADAPAEGDRASPQPTPPAPAPGH